MIFRKKVKDKKKKHLEFQFLIVENFKNTTYQFVVS